MDENTTQAIEALAVCFMVSALAWAAAWLIVRTVTSRHRLLENRKDLVPTDEDG